MANIDPVEVQEEAPATETVAVGKAKSKAKKEENLILAVAQEVESLTKGKALHMAQDLANAIEIDYLKLGGVLNLISANSWYEGFDSFGAYVLENFGFAERKAWYLIGIYKNLVEKQIPWEKVQGLGWSKLKELAEILTLENVDEWVAKASHLTVMELQALLKGSTDKASAETTDEFQNLKFKVKNDQLETINLALAKAKGELHTEYDAVALENICSGYLAGVVGGAVPDLTAVINSFGLEAVLSRVSELFPEYDINVSPAEQNTGG